MKCRKLVGVEYCYSLEIPNPNCSIFLCNFHLLAANSCLLLTLIIAESRGDESVTIFLIKTNRQASLRCFFCFLTMRARQSVLPSSVHFPLTHHRKCQQYIGFKFKNLAYIQATSQRMLASDFSIISVTRSLTYRPEMTLNILPPHKMNGCSSMVITEDNKKSASKQSILTN